MDTGKIIHYPRLDSVLMVEKLIYENSGAFSKKQLWDKLPRKMMYQTFSAIIGYLVYSGKISINTMGKIIWIAGMQLEYLNKEVGKGMNKELEKISKKIVEFLKEKGVTRAGIFGSYARGEQKKNSDIDILIEVDKNEKFSLLDLVGLENKIKDRLKKRIDLLTYNGLSPLLRKKILEEEVRII